MEEIGTDALWHGRLMVLAWVFLFPLGVLIARFCKILPAQEWPRQADNQLWWRSHLILQYGGAVCVAIALWLVQSSLTSFSPEFTWHRLLGWITLVLLVIQIVSAWLRGSKGGPGDKSPDGSLRGDHFDMSRRRRLFERLHKSNGYLALVLAVATVLTGLSHAGAPGWMYICLFLWWLVLLVLFIVCQRAGLRINTYHAIWGLTVSSRVAPGIVPSIVSNHPWHNAAGTRLYAMPPDTDESGVTPPLVKPADTSAG